MDPFITSVYISEISIQCQLALNAIHIAKVSLDQINRTDDFDKIFFLQNEVFRNVHSFLVHAGVVSKFLWPSLTGLVKERKKFASDRGKSLRGVLDLSNDNHPLKDRTIRNHLEHLDTRLDDWVITSQRHIYVQYIIGSPGDIKGSVDTDIMCVLDPLKLTYYFRGEIFDLKSLEASLIQVYSGASELKK